jgi:hypothetical protein
MERMEKQTAIEWLVEQIVKEKGLVDLDIQAAKEMEKEQICQAYAMGVSPSLSMFRMWKCGEEYYNKTFKSE